MNYSDQLKTIHWKKLRNTTLKRDNYECSTCKNQNLVENSEYGSILELRQQRTVVYLFNRDDPRFYPGYKLKFKNKQGELFEEEIKSSFEYDNSTLKTFDNKPIYISHKKYKKNGYIVS